MVERNSQCEEQAERKTELADFLGSLSLPISLVSFLCLLAGFVHPAWVFVILWIGYFMAMYGSRFAIGLGRSLSTIVILIVPCFLLFCYLFLLLPNVQRARE